MSHGRRLLPAMFALSAVASSLAPRIARASLPREPPEECIDRAAQLEISPWLSLGGGLRFGGDGSTSAIGVLAADTALTIPLTGTSRIGAWTAPGTTDFASFDLPAGVRLEHHSNELNRSHSDFFGVSGRWTMMLDLGVGNRFGAEGNRGSFWVARASFGFTAPNRLYHLYNAQPACHCARSDDPQQQQIVTPEECRPARGEVSGVRPFIGMQRAFDGDVTELTFGLTFETVGAGWWIGAGL